MSRSASRTSTPAEQVLKQEITFPQSQSPEHRDPEDKPSFWEQIHAIPDDLWSANGEKGYRIYLYQPQGNRRGTNLATLTQPFDMDWVRENYGGGDYEASLHDPGWKIVASIRFSIEGESKRKPVQSAQSAGVPLPTTDSFQSQVLEILRETTRRQEQMMERMLSERTSNHPPSVAAAIDPTTMFTSLVSMVKEIMPSAQPQQMNILEQLKLLKELSGPDMFTVLERCKAAGLIGGAGAGGTLMEQLETVLAVADKVGGGKSKSLGEAVIEKLPDILEAGGKAIDKYQQIESTRLKVAQEVRAIQQNGRAVVTPPPPGGPQANPAHPQQPGAPQVLPPSPGGVPPQQQQSSGIGLEVEPLPGTQAGAAVAEMTEAQMNAVKQQVVQAIGRGMSGADIFGYLNTTAPAFLNGFVLRDAAGNVTGVVTEAQLTGYCSNDPILKQGMGLARFKPCVRELLQEIEYFLGLDEQADDEEAGPRLN